MDNELEQQSSKIAIFKGKQIRKIIHQGEWYFSIIDIVAVLTESPNPRRYWSNLKIQLSENKAFVQLYSKTVQLKLMAPDGKMRETDTAIQPNPEVLHFRVASGLSSEFIV